MTRRELEVENAELRDALEEARNRLHRLQVDLQDALGDEEADSEDEEEE